MLDKIEMSLDDIIKSNKSSSFKTKRRGGGGGGPKKFGNSSPAKKIGGGIAKGRARGGITRSKYTRGDVNSSWKHDLFEGGRKPGVGGALGARVQGGSTKLVVSNLDFSVSDGDINELFAEFGPLKNASVHYDRSGRSLGTADVVFERRNDAAKAMKQYNGVPLDGRPMSIQLATSEVLPGRVQPQRPQNNTFNRSGPPRGAPRGAPRGGPRRGGFKGGQGSGRRERKPEVTVDDLNAELDAYTMQG